MNNLFEKTIGRILNSMGYCLRPINQFFSFDALLNSHIRRNENLFFVQLGACDGVTFDPLYRFVTNNHNNIKGIVVEPVSEYFKELQYNYRKYPNIITVQAAIHNKEEEMTIYRVDPLKMNGLEPWAKCIASFNENHHKLSGTSSNIIIQEKVQCITLDNLLEKNQVSQLDLLQIDTEGYDAEIIMNINFNISKPKILRFEHGLPDKIMSKEVFLQVINKLHKHNYEIAVEFYDATAYQHDVILSS
ncbi:MAG: FkbM family methyltransferase [Bacteroidetes bacterium]|nr:FkbM family methyltransferase [Bacteroidota bacterium]